MDYGYLEAKRNLDDRSMNQRVWESFRDGAQELRSKRSGEFRILEIGAGSGGMTERLQDWGLLDSLAAEGPLHYEVVEPQEELIPVLRERLSGKGELSGWRVFHGSVQEYRSQERGGRADLLIAHAVLDLFTAVEAARLASQLLREEGLLYGSITFDGESYFEPVVDKQLDAAVRRAYHESMAREGEPESGFARKLLTALPMEGLEIEEVGSSDWIILPRRGSYYPKEAEFLLAILDMVDASVSDRLEQSQRQRWINERRRQVGEGSLIYIAHQLDILGRKGSRS